MKLKELCSYLDSAVPLSFQEDYDNSGLQIGFPGKDISSALVALEITEEVIKEAFDKRCDVLISHHPLIFKGIKHLTSDTSTERIIYEAVKHNIAIYSAHTNLDVISNGVSRKMAEKLELTGIEVLSPVKKLFLKLVTYIPESYLDKVRDAVFNAGAGVIGNYDCCSFSCSGKGSFRGNEMTTPFVGEKGKLHYENEVRFETILFAHNRKNVINALLESHPYEEVAYDLYSLENDNCNIGTGCTGFLKNPLSETDFLKLVSTVFNSKGIRYSNSEGKPISKVALCGGSGAFLIDTAISSGSDAYVTADIKYHEFFKPEGRILLVDAGHFETEKFSTEILKDLIIKKFPKFAVRFSDIYTNPINYY